MFALHGAGIYAGIVVGTNLLDLGFQLHPPQNRIWQVGNRALHTVSLFVLSYSCYREWLTGYESLLAHSGVALIAALPLIAPLIVSIQHGAAWMNSTVGRNVLRAWDVLYLSMLVVSEEISISLGIAAISSCAITIIAQVLPHWAAE